MKMGSCYSNSRDLKTDYWKKMSASPKHHQLATPQLFALAVLQHTRECTLFGCIGRGEEGRGRREGLFALAVNAFIQSDDRVVVQKGLTSATPEEVPSSQNWLLSLSG